MTVRAETARNVQNFPNGAIVIAVTHADTNDDAIAASLAAGTAPPARTIANAATVTAIIQGPGGAMPAGVDAAGAAVVAAP